MAEPKTIKERINSDTNKRIKFFALEYLNENLAFLQNNFGNAIRIDTTSKDCDNITKEILTYINDD